MLGKTTVPLQHSLMCINVFKSSSEIFLRAPWRTLQSCLFGHWPPLTSHCFTFLSRHPELRLAVWDHSHEKSVANQKISRWRCTMAQTLKVHFYIQKTTWHEFQHSCLIHKIYRKLDLWPWNSEFLFLRPSFSNDYIHKPACSGPPAC